MNQERRDELAKLIDPLSWELAQTPGFKDAPAGPGAINLLLADSRAAADRIVESGLMNNFDWERSEYISARKKIISRTSRRGFCYSVENGLDGYVMHDPRCPSWPESAISGGDCIK